MSKTKIEWSDETWPVVTGCSHAGSPGCDSCYAARMAATRLKHHPRYESLATISNGNARWTGEVRLNHDVLEQPLHWEKPRMVFIASMGDLFHPSVPDDFICEVFYKVYRSSQHTFQVLTKRPQRMLDWFKRPEAQDSKWHKPLPNLWLGVSVENQAAADERIPQLLQTPAAVRFVSVEPMLGVVDLSQYLSSACLLTTVKHLQWIIVGGESGPGARPMHPDWVRSLRDQCQAAGVPFFFKQWGAWVPFGQGQGHAIPEQAPGCWLDVRGGLSSSTYSAMMHEPSALFRIGKKAAGHLLDGRTWQQFPAADGAGNR